MRKMVNFCVSAQLMVKAWHYLTSALVLAIVATTLVHVPRSFFLDVDMRALSLACIDACDRISWNTRDKPNLDYLCTK
jgi:hypothetical protein